MDRDYWLQVAEETMRLAQEGSLNRTNKSRRNRVNSISNNVILVDRIPILHRENDMRLYISAAQAFRIAGKWTDASKAYIFASHIFLHELKLPSHAASLMLEAGICARKMKGKNGIECFSKVSDIYCDLEEYRKAAVVRLMLAKSMSQEDETEFCDEITQEFLLASKFFRAANVHHPSMECLKNAAYITAMNGNFKQASIMYQEVAEHMLKLNLTKYSAHRFFFRAALLLMCTSSSHGSDVHDAIHQMAEMDCRFQASSHFLLLRNIRRILVEPKGVSSNKDDFADHLYHFHHAYPLEYLDVKLFRIIYESHFSSDYCDVDKK